jgi:hypothetical protein
MKIIKNVYYLKMFIMFEYSSQKLKAFMNNR